MKILFLIGNPPGRVARDWKEIQEYKNFYSTPTKDFYRLIKGLENNKEFENKITSARKNMGLSEDGISWEEYISKYMLRSKFQTTSKPKLTEEEAKKVRFLYIKAAKEIAKIQTTMNLDYFVDIQLPYLVFGNFVYFESLSITWNHSPINEFEEDSLDYIRIEIKNRITRNELIKFIENSWSDINQLINHLPPKIDFFVSERDERIIELREKENMNFKSIAEKIIEEFKLDNIADEINEDSIKSAYYRWKKKYNYLATELKKET